MARLCRLSFLAAFALLSATADASTKHCTVAYAGSMAVVMDRHLGPTFARSRHCRYRGIAGGAWALARRIRNKQLVPDVYFSITPGPMRYLRKAGLIHHFRPIARTEMVIAYSRHSRFKRSFQQAAAGKLPWYRPLERRGLRFGRTDPRTDPQGRNIIFAFLLAQRTEHQPHLLARVLGPIENHRQIFSEPALLSRLEAGQIDASSGYLSAVVSMHLPYLRLPPGINLGHPRRFGNAYARVSFRLKDRNGKTERVHPEPLVFYAAIPRDAPHPALGRAFVRFATSPRGQKMLRAAGYTPVRQARQHGKP